MTKGYIQLSFIGKQDYKLIGNPKICFWKKVYRQHTNFSSQSIEIECDDSVQMAENKKTVYRFKIRRYADMVNFISLTLDLPEISVKSCGSDKYFKWITNIGANIIQSACIYYDDILIEEIDSDFILINKDMNYTSAQSETFDKLIGNISEIYTPVPPSGNTHPYRLNIPLPFCFFRNKTNIPLLCNNLREVFVEITLRPINDIYLIGTTKTESLISPSPQNQDCSNTPIPGPGTCMSYIQWNKPMGCDNFMKYSQSTNIKPTLEVNYIYLDNDERNTISQKPLIQILPIVKRYNFNTLMGKVKLYLDAFHPLKTLYIIAKKDNVACTNQWDNYTNKDYFNQENLYLQTNLLSYIKSEVNKISTEYENCGEEFDINALFVKLLGCLLPYDSNGSSFQPKTNVQLYVNDTGSLTDIKIIKSDGEYTHKPLFKIISNTGENAKLDANMKITRIIIKNPGDNYLTEPIIISSDKTLSFKAVIKNQKISEVLIINNSVIQEMPTLTVTPTLHISEIKHLHFGHNYITIPYIIAYLDEDLVQKNFTSPILFRGKLKGGKIISSTRINTSAPNKNETTATVFIGGILNTITPKITSMVYDNNFNMPSLHFRDAYNNILSPVVCFEGGDVIIKSRGAGLTKHTHINVGRVLYEINNYESELFKEEITLHLEYKYYAHKTSPLLSSTKKPIITSSLPAITGILPKYELVLKHTYMINNITQEYPDVGSIFKNASISHNHLIIEYNDEYLNYKHLLLELQLHTLVPTNVYTAIKRFLPHTNIVEVPIKLILNHNDDITALMNEFDIFSYNIIDTNIYNALFITHKLGSIRSLPDILKEGDIITLLINDIYVNTCTIHIIDELIYGWDTSSQANILDIIMNGVGLYFSGVGPNPFVFDVVRPIDNLKMISNGYGISSVPRAYIKSNTHIDIPVEFNIENLSSSDDSFKLDHGGKDASATIELDFGGTIKQLNDYVDVTINNGKVHMVEFNKLYIDSGYTWDSYSSVPLFIYKSKLITEYYLTNTSTENHSKVHKRDNDILDINDEITLVDIYEDALVTGIIDMGGEGFNGNIIYDNGGFSAKLTLEEKGKNHFSVKCSNMGYNYTENITSSIIAYDIDSIGDVTTRLVYQFNSNINNLGQLDTNKKFVNNKFNRIYISHKSYDTDSTKNEINEEYNIVDSEMNIHTRYLIVTGHIPNKNINIISPGDNYGINESNNDTILEFKLLSHPDFLDNSGIDCQYIIDNYSIIDVTIATVDGNIPPFVKYIYDSENGIRFEKLDNIIRSKLKLTSFKVIDGGNGIYNKNEMYFYNGFITDLRLIDNGNSYTMPPKVYVVDSKEKVFLDVELDKTQSGTEMGHSLLNISYPETHKLFIINQRGHYILSKYKNISLKPLLGNKTCNFIFFDSFPSVVIGGEVTEIKLSTPINIQDISLLSYNSISDIYTEDSIPQPKKSNSTESYFIESSIGHSDTSRVLRKTMFNDISVLKIYEDIGYTRASIVDIGYPLNELNIEHMGDEIDESKYGYDVVVLNKYNERVHANFSPTIIIKGNNNPIKGNTYSITVRGDGGGSGAMGSATIIKGTGATLSAMAEIDSFNIIDVGEKYLLSDTIECESKFHQWASISKPISIPIDHLMTKEEISKFLNIWSLRNKNDIPIIDSDKKYNFYSSDIIKKLGVVINNEVREDLRDADYYKTTEKFFMSPNANYNNILQYSASLNNIKFQPMGSINLETLNKFAIVLELLEPGRFESYHYDVSIFTLSYNIINYVNGMGGLVYGN